jgi:excisionase family DNA binding protein
VKYPFGRARRYLTQAFVSLRGMSAHVAIPTLEEIREVVRQEVDRALAVRPEMTGWLGVTEAADYLKTTPQGIYDLIRHHSLPRHKAGGRLLFNPYELDAWVEASGA